MLKRIFSGSKIRPWLILSLLLLLALQAAGCGSSSDTAKNEAGENFKLEAVAVQTEDMIAAPRMPNQAERKIIQNVDLTIKVDHVQAVMDNIIQLTREKDGYIVSSSIYKNEDYYRASLTVKIPQEKLADTVNTISGLGEITHNDTYTEDVTEEYYDAQARLKVLEAKETRLIALLDKAADIPDIVAIENELAKVRSEIEVIKGRLQYLTNSTSFSTINIHLLEAVPGQITAPQGTTGKAWQGLINSINKLIDFSSNLIVLLVTLLPWLAVLAVIYFIVRTVKNKRKKTKDIQ